MTETPDKQEKRRQVLERLRERFGEERDEVLEDIDGLGILTLFLQPIDDAADTAVPERQFTREDLAKIRRVRKEQKQRRKDQGTGPPPVTDAESESDAEDGVFQFPSLSYDVLVEQIPQLRENLGQWLAEVDAEFTPSATSLEELRLLRRKVEFRLRALTLMVNETQRELDNLVVTIRATESQQGEDG